MRRVAFLDGSQLVALGAIHAGVDYFVGYPITPASGIFSEMLRLGVGIAAPDEITALQYLIGASLNGRKAMTATSGPGFLLMAEGVGAAMMMETPLLLVLVQRLGPATGSATMNAQGDVCLAGNIVSGGFPVPVICPSTVEECAGMTARATNVAERLRVPVVLLTEKEMVVGKRTVDLDALDLPEPVTRRRYEGAASEYRPYGNLDEHQAPLFRPLGDPDVQVRATASTHDPAGAICAFSEKVRKDTERLLVSNGAGLLPQGVLDRQDGAEDLVIAYGFTSYAAREAVAALRSSGRKTSLLLVRTLFPVLAEQVREAMAGIRRVVFPEENIRGQYRKVLMGEGVFDGIPDRAVAGVNVMGRPISPEEIVRAVLGEPPSLSSGAGAMPCSGAPGRPTAQEAQR